jgi:hypothetical protein
MAALHQDRCAEQTDDLAAAHTGVDLPECPFRETRRERGIAHNSA